jgi:hypothetical protein
MGTRKKATAKKPAAKKPAGKSAKSPAKKATKNSAAKKATKKSAAKKAAPKKAAPKKSAAKKAAPKKAPPKKAAPAKSTAKRPAPKKSASSSSAPSSAAGGSVIEAYARKFPKWAAIVQAVEALVQKQQPDASAVMKWSHPVFVTADKPFALVRVLGKHVLFGFWGGLDLDDPKHLLEGVALKHVKLYSLKDLDEPELARFVRDAVKLNLSR